MVGTVLLGYEDFRVNWVPGEGKRRNVRLNGALFINEKVDDHGLEDK